MTLKTETPHVAIIGGGFCALAAGYELSKQGIRTTILERDEEIGGLAGSFRVNGVRLEKFYHHWFKNDKHVMDLILELGNQDQVLLRPTRTGMYFANNFFQLSTPLDLLRFSPLALTDRVRLGWLALQARRVKHWRELEDLTAVEWLKSMGGQKVFEVVWEPLLRGKFGDLAAEVSAVWFWNKLKLRGGSRGKGGEEQLAYYQGGFAALADDLAAHVEMGGGRVCTGAHVDALVVEGGRVVGVRTGREEVRANMVIATPALPIIADLMEPYVSAQFIAKLRRVKYLANICVVLELNRSLSNTYWLNVNDPDFPFVGVIEHTNFEPTSTYKGRHIVYLSKYLPQFDALFQMSEQELLEFTLPHLQRMFPAFQRDWILDHHVWRANYSQPLVERRYSDLIPPNETPLPGFYIATMAQIYPEDRGTNYAIREGRKVARQVAQTLA